MSAAWNRIALRVPPAALLLLAIALACGPMWWIYGTPRLVVAVIAALIVGAGIGVLGAVRRWSSLTLLLVGLVALLVVVPPLASPERIAGGDVVGAYADGTAALVLSWRKLLTIGTPVGAADALLAAPVLLVLVASLAGTSYVLRGRRPELAAIAPALLLVWGVLWGPREAPLAWISGLTVMIGIVAFVSTLRQQRRRRRYRRVLSSFARRFAFGGVTVIAVAAIAGAVGATTPLGDRVVLRDEQSAALTALHDASPLSAFRSFWQQEARTERQLTVTGLEPGERIRLAALDGYNGTVATVEHGRFERVAPFERAGDRTIGVTIGALESRWVPVAGTPGDVRFIGDRADELADSLHSDPSLGALIVDAGLRDGDGYLLHASAGPRIESPAALGELEPTGSQQEELALPEPMLERLAAWTAGADSPGEQLQAAVEGMLATGYVSHGVLDDEPSSRAGHSLARLAELFDEPMVGDAEQYAMAAVLLARQLGFEARVVVGFSPAEITAGTPVDVLGADADAWMEVRSGSGWIGVDVTPELRPIPDDESERPQSVEEPPAQHAPVPPEGGQEDLAVPATPGAPQQRDDSNGALAEILGAIGAIAGVLALVAALPAGLLATKALRRRRRRNADDPRDRVAGAWAEAVDGLRDRGVSVDPLATRLEQADADAPMRELANAVDRAVFAARPPDDEAVEAAWRASDRVLSDRDADAAWWIAATARLNPASLVQRDALADGRPSPAPAAPPAPTLHSADRSGRRGR